MHSIALGVTALQSMFVLCTSVGARSFCTDILLFLYCTFYVCQMNMQCLVYKRQFHQLWLLFGEVFFVPVLNLNYLDLYYATLHFYILCKRHTILVHVLLDKTQIRSWCVFVYPAYVDLETKEDDCSKAESLFVTYSLGLPGNNRTRVTTIEAPRCCASATKPNYRFPDSENQIPIRWRYTSTSGTHDAPAACSSSLWLYYSASSPLPASPLHYCLIIILAAGAGDSDGTRFWKALRWNRILMDCLLHGHLERSP